jgi:hypothetical protein
MSRLTTSTDSDSAPVASPLPVGDIQFLDNFIPTLDPGQYTVGITQTLGFDGKPPAGAPTDFPPAPFSSAMTMTVGGAGLALASTDIYSVYPPDKSTADYTQVLPHVVLNTRTLPWEVQLASSPETTPWMALVLLADSDVVQTQTLTLAAAQQPATGLITPQVPASEAANTTTSVTVVDITAANFAALMPQLSEVSYLTHCRQVNVAGKEDGLTSGWFSVCVANRFPSVPSGQPNAHFTAHLVSIYGLDSYLATPATPLPSGTTTVRLLSLANWSFTCDPANALDFRALMTNLATPPAGTATGDSSYMLLKLPTSVAQSSSGNVNFSDPIHQAVKKAFDTGYALTPYHTRQGDAVTAWYRGPLCPTPTTRLPLDPISLSGEAMIYDATTGLFDQSYAVAWETGRLLALSDKSFAANLLAWRTKGQQLLNQLYFNIQQNPALAGTMAQASANPNAQELRSLVEPDVLASTTFLPYVAAAFAQTVGIDIPTPASVPVPAAADAPTSGVTASVSAALTELVGQPWVQSALQALTQDQLDVIAEWLGRICLLNGVPFANLVPDARMLPTESIRFFYVDQTYLDAMVDGALSVGVRSSRDTQFNEIMHAVLRDAVDSEMATVRAELLGLTPSAQGVAGAMSGFLMRSAVVSGFPGLDVEALQSDGVTPMPALRIDRPSPNVMIALFPSVPSQVAISEPQEGMRFGVEDESKIELRDVSTTGTPGAELGVTATALYRPGQVFDVTGTLGAIGTQAPALASIGPAGFAVQVVKSPERMVFYGAVT